MPDDANVQTTIVTPSNPQKWLATMFERARERRIYIEVRITPQLAEMMLGYNKENRHQRRGRIKTHTAQMKGRKWDFTGEGIKFSNLPRLIDGQHRLEACVRSGVPFDTLVIFGLDDVVRRSLDQGAKRKASDVLKGEGFDNSGLRSNALAWIARLERGTAHQLDDAVRPQPRDFIELSKGHPELETSLHVGAEARKMKLLSMGMATALHYMFSKRDRQLADSFFKKLLSGVGLNEHESVYLLFRRLDENVKTRSKKLTEPAKAAITIKTWNACRRGTHIKYLRFREGEDFPDIE